MNTIRSHVCSTVMDNELWACGGLESGDVSLVVEAYNGITDSWRKITDLNNPRWGASCQVVGGTLILAGGCGGSYGGSTGEQTLDVEIYSTCENKFNLIAPLLHYAMDAASCVIDEKLYIAGGSLSRYLQIWDKKTGNWTRGADMRKEQDSAGCLAYKGWMMVFGGNRCNLMSMYNPQNNRWSNGPALPYNEPVKAIEYQDKIVVIGSSGLFQLDKKLETWSRFRKLRKSVMYPSVGCIEI